MVSKSIKNNNDTLTNVAKGIWNVMLAQPVKNLVPVSKNNKKRAKLKLSNQSYDYS